MKDQKMLQMAADLWEMYQQEDWKGKLDLMRHSLSVSIDSDNGAYACFHMILDESNRRDYRVKVRQRGDVEDTGMRAFVLFLFALKSGETKMFRWSTGLGETKWILSRHEVSLYFEAPGLSFFIRYGVFRDAFRDAYERFYSWGHGLEKRMIKVPVSDYRFLETLDTQDEFELVRYVEDGHSFETTDVDRLLRYINECRDIELATFDAEKDRILGYRRLCEAIEYCAKEQKCLRRREKLLPGTGIEFARLKDNWEVNDFYYDFSADHNERHYLVYRRYGTLPDGRHYGVCIWPQSEAWPPISVLMIVRENGEMTGNTEIDDRWDVPDSVRWPLAVTASPSGKCLIWLKDGEIWAWHFDEKEGDFISGMGECLNKRLENLPVTDAYMGKDGVLALFVKSEESKYYAYLCDEDIVLTRYLGEHEFAWIPANQREAPGSESHLKYWPDSFAVIIRKENDAYDYFDCGVRRVCFETGLEVIKAGMLAENPDLESVTIPESVKEVQTWAFGCCSKLKNLVIRGDLSRVANWAENAFESCACEEYYLRIRNSRK